MTGSVAAAPARDSKPPPHLPELLLGADLSAGSLRSRPDAEQLGPLIALAENADYWLSFQAGAFRPPLASCPSPLRQLAVGIALRYGHAIDGGLEPADLDIFAETIGGGLPEDLATAVKSGIDTLRRMIAAYAQQAAWLEDGWEVYAPESSLSVHELRASGTGTILIDGGPPRGAGAIDTALGAPVVLSATDERGRPLTPPAIERPDHWPVLSRTDEAKGERTAILFVPGKYRVRVPGKAHGALSLFAR